VRDEGGDPDDGVVAPEGGSELHCGQPGGEQWPVELVGKLLGTGEERLAVHQGGAALENAYPRVTLHQLHHPDEGPAFHQAVGVDHHHIVVEAPPATQEVSDVAAL